jgi:hypothetical protein
MARSSYTQWKGVLYRGRGGEARLTLPWVIRGSDYAMMSSLMSCLGQEEGEDGGDGGGDRLRWKYIPDRTMSFFFWCVTGRGWSVVWNTWNGWNIDSGSCRH